MDSLYDYTPSGYAQVGVKCALHYSNSLKMQWASLSYSFGFDVNDDQSQAPSPLALILIL